MFAYLRKIIAGGISESQCVSLVSIAKDYFSIYHEDVAPFGYLVWTPNDWRVYGYGCSPAFTVEHPLEFRCLLPSRASFAHIRARTRGCRDCQSGIVPQNRMTMNNCIIIEIADTYIRRRVQETFNKLSLLDVGILISLSSNFTSNVLYLAAVFLWWK